MNAGAILSLIGDLYSQIAQLTDENQQLRDALGKPPTKPNDA